MEHSTPFILPRPDVLDYLRAFARSYRPEEPAADYLQPIGTC